MFEFKPLSKKAVKAAQIKAVRYRVLNEPAEAESICRDILAVEPDNQSALVTLLLAMTDQFPRGLGPRLEEAVRVLDATGLTPEIAGKFVANARSLASAVLSMTQWINDLEEEEGADDE